MSLVPEQVPLKPVVSAPSVVWSRVLGGGAIHRDFGHHIATNRRGDILVAARLDPVGERPSESDDPPDTLGRDEATVDLSRGELVKLAPDGEPLWRLALRATRLLPAPHVALDAAGCAYVAGPYEPQEGGLRGGGAHVALTKLRQDSSVEWSRSLFDAPVEAGRSSVPVVRVAAAPGGGACVTWVGERRRWRALRTLRLASDGGVMWDYAWPIIGDAHDPCVGVDADGATVVWGAFRGTLAFADGVTAESKSEGRYLARILEDGKVTWAYPLRAIPNAAFSMSVGPGGEIGQAWFVPSVAAKSTDAPAVLALSRIDSAGEPGKGIFCRCERHTSVPWLSLAPTYAGGFAVAGYFSGGLRFGDIVLRSMTPASEAVFLAWSDASGLLSAAAFQGPQLQAGLSVHGVSGGVLLGGWLSGALNLGPHKIQSPGHTAGLFLAKLTLA